MWHDVRQIWKVCYDVPQIRKTLDYLKIRESVRSENLTKYYLCKEKFFCIFLSTLLDIQAQSEINLLQHELATTLWLFARALEQLEHSSTWALRHLGTWVLKALGHFGTWALEALYLGYSHKNHQGFPKNRWIIHLGTIYLVHAQNFTPWYTRIISKC